MTSGEANDTRGGADGKVALVTGGGGVPAGDAFGVGAGICMVLASEGYKVGVLDVDRALAEETAARITADGGEALVLQADVSEAAACIAAVQELVGHFGRLDALVNNVGVFAGAPMVEVEETEWDRHMAVNVKGMMLMARAAVPHLPPEGAIVNISSTGAYRPVKGTAAYVTSKGAVVTLTLAMAVELAPVRANCLCPDRIWTPRFVRRVPPEQIEAMRESRRRATLLEREGDAMDVAHATAFFLSDRARWITGQVLTLDGGRGLMAGVSEAGLSPHGEQRVT